jgi:hypothetical protein
MSDWIWFAVGVVGGAFLAAGLVYAAYKILIYRSL